MISLLDRNQTSVSPCTIPDSALFVLQAEFAHWAPPLSRQQQQQQQPRRHGARERADFRAQGSGVSVTRVPSLRETSDSQTAGSTT